jgi:hypothetical protein
MHTEGKVCGVRATVVRSTYPAQPAYFEVTVRDLCARTDSHAEHTLIISVCSYLPSLP